MAYIPESNSVVAFQSDATKLVATVSIVGVPNPSSVYVVNPVSTLAIATGNSSVQVLNPVSLLAVNPNPSSVYVVNPVSTLAIATGNSSVQIVGITPPHSVATLQGTNPWITSPNPSSVYVVNPVSTLSISTGNSSVLLLGGNAVIGSVAVLQGTDPWKINMPSGSVLGTYLEKNAVTPSAFGTPILFKIDETNSVLSAVSPQSPFPVQGSVAALQGSTPWQVNVPTPSYITYQAAGSVLNANISGSVAAVINNSSVQVVGIMPPQSVSGVGLFNVNHIGNGSIVVISQGASSSSVYAVLSSITTVSIATTNTNRKGLTIYNRAETDLYVKLGVNATTSIYTVLMNNNDYYEIPAGYTGVVAGITASNAGIINVTELT